MFETLCASHKDELLGLATIDTSPRSSMSAAPDDKAVNSQAQGLLERDDIVHDDQQARSDRTHLIHLYDRLASHVKPYLEAALANERVAEPVDILALAARSVCDDLNDRIPGVDTRLVPKDAKKFKEKLSKLVKRDEDEASELRLRLLVANTSRAIVNAWVTDLDRHYKAGLVLNRFLLRKRVNEGLIERALEPFNVADLRRQFVLALRDFAESLVADKNSVLDLPGDLVIVSVPHTIEKLGEFDELALYRRSDISAEFLKSLPAAVSKALDESQSDIEEPVTSPDTESFSLRQMNLWTIELTSAPTASDTFVLTDSALPDGTIDDIFVERTRRCAHRELGIHSFNTDNTRRLMRKFFHKLAGSIGSDEITIRDGLRISSDNGKLTVTRNNSKSVDSASSSSKLFDAMFQAASAQLQEYATR